MSQQPIATAYVAITASIQGLRRTVERELRAPVEKAAKEAGETGGRDLGRGLTEGLRRNRPTGKDLGLEDLQRDVEKAERRMTRSVESHARNQADAKRQVQIAQAKVTESTEKYGAETSQALAATDRLIKAERVLAEATSAAADEQDGLQQALLESRAHLAQAQQAASSTSRGFTRAFNSVWAARIQTAMRSAVSSPAVAAAAGVAGYVAGTRWASGFKDGIDDRRLTGFLTGTLAKMAGLRAVADFARQAGDAFQNMDRHVTALANSGTQIAGIAAIAVAAGGAILGVSHGFGSMAATALALPGILAAAGASLAILVAALNDFATVLPGVTEEYAKLGGIASENFWARAAGPIENAAYTILPILRDGVASVAHEFGGWAVAISNTVTQLRYLGILEDAFVNLRRAVDIAGDGVGQFTGGLLGLIGVGMSYLPALAGAFNRMSWAFEVWVQTNTDNGNMWRWIDAGLTQFRYLGQTIGGTISFLGGLQSAAVAAGSPQGFGALATGMQAAADAVNSAPWQTALTGLFQGANDGVRALAAGFTLMTPGLQSILPVLGQVMDLTGQTIAGIMAGVGDLMAHPAVQGGLVTFFTAVRDAVTELAPSAGVLGDLFGALASLAAQLVFAIAGTLDAALKAIGPAFVGVSEAVRPLIPAVSSIAQSVITGMGPALGFLGGLITDVVVPPIVTLFEWISGFPGVLGGAGIALVGFIAANAALTGLAYAVIVPISAFIKFLPVLKVGLLGVKLAMAGVNFVMGLNPIAKVVLALSALVAGAVWAYQNIGWFKDGVDAAWAGIKTAAAWAWDGIKTIIGGFVGWITGTVWPGIQSALTAISDGWSSITATASDAWGGIKSLIAGFVGWITGTVVPGVQTALAAVGSVFSWLNTNIIQPIWYGMRYSAALAGAAILTVVDGIVWVFENLLAPAFTWLKDSVVVPVWEGIKSAISAAWSWVRDTVMVPLGTFVRNNVGAAWDWLRDKVTGVWGGIKSAVSAAWTWVRDVVMIPLGLFLRENVGAAWQWLQDKVTAVWSSIKTAVSTAWNWVRNSVFVPAVDFVRGAVVNSWTFLRDTVSNVWRGIRDTASSVWSWIRNSVFVPAVNFVRGAVVNSWTFLRDTVSNVWRGIRNTVSSVWNWIKSNVINPMVTAVRETTVSAFETARDGIRKAWDAIKAIVAKPVEFVINTVIRDGFVANFNKIAEKFKINTIDFKGVNLSGFRTGGYTGRKPRDEVAGVVHGDEQVIRSESRRAIEATAPGLLDRMNRFGAGALSPVLGHEGHNHGAAAGGPGGPGGALWGPLQDRIYASGIAHLAGSIPGVNMGAVARAWSSMSKLKVRRGNGPNQITGRGGGSLGNWGYAWTNGNFEVSPVVPGPMRQPVAIHELGHVLGLMHESSGRSIMHPMMRGPSWPGSFDRATIQRIYGGSGKGNPPEGGGGGGFSIGDVIGNVWGGISKAIGLDGLLAKMPGGGIMSDVMKGAARTAFDGLKGYISSTLESVADRILPDWTDDLVGKLFGGRALAPTVYDGGGWLRRTGEAQLVQHRKAKPDAVLTNQQFRDFHGIAQSVREQGSGTGRGVHIDQVNTFDTAHLKQELVTMVRQEEALYGVR